MQVIWIHTKSCHQMLQNDIIKVCKMMLPHSNEPAIYEVELLHASIFVGSFPYLLTWDAHDIWRQDGGVPFVVLW